MGLWGIIGGNRIARLKRAIQRLERQEPLGQDDRLLRKIDCFDLLEVQSWEPRDVSTLDEIIAILSRMEARCSNMMLANLLNRLRKLRFSIGLADTGRVPSFLLITLPKSGTWYVQDKLIKHLGLDISRVAAEGTHLVSANSRLLPFHFDRHTNFRYGGSVCACHIPATAYNRDLIAQSGLRCLVLMRDPRQTLLSYFHMIERDFAVSGMGMATEFINEEYLRKSRTDKLDWLIENYFPQQLIWILGWIEAAAGDLKDCVLLKTLEEMKRNEVAFFHDTLKFFGVKRQLWFSESSAEMRADMVNGVQYRRGQLDEWKRGLTDQQRIRIDTLIAEHAFGQVLVDLGWQDPEQLPLAA